jgi:ureidoglycolate lyase
MTPASNYSRRRFLAQTAISGTALFISSLAKLPANPSDNIMRTPASIPPLPSGNLYATHGPAPAETAPVHTRLSLRAEVVTAENFAPFGLVLTPAGRPRLPINTYGDNLDLYREGFESDQPIEWFIFAGRARGTRVLFLERHQQLSQTFIPVNGRGFYTVMAPPNCPEENGFPALTQLKAFFVPGDVPIQIHRATWHENPMPATDDTRLLVTSHANLTAAHRQNPDPQLASLPRDLERRWYLHGGYELTVTSV